MDLQLKTTSGDVAYNTVESGTSENMGIAFGMSLIAALEPEISWGLILPPVTKNGCKKIVTVRGLR